MNDNFNRAFEYVIKNEGRFVNDPMDSGGPTKYGITIATLSAWRKHQVTPEDVQNLQREEAFAIYKAWYWIPSACDRITSLAVATALFDTGVLFGTGAAHLCAARALAGSSSTVAVFNPQSIVDAINALEPKAFLQAFHTQLQRLISEIIAKRPKNAKFRQGWENRIDRFLTLVA